MFIIKLNIALNPYTGRYQNYDKSKTELVPKLKYN